MAETGEQVRYLEQVAALETRLQALQGDEIKARLHLFGMCDEANMARIDAYLDTFHEENNAVDQSHSDCRQHLRHLYPRRRAGRGTRLHLPRLVRMGFKGRTGRKWPTAA